MNTSVIRDSLKYLQSNFRSVSKLSRWIYELQVDFMYSKYKLERSFLVNDVEIFDILVKFANKETLDDILDKNVIQEAKKEIDEYGIHINERSYINVLLYLSKTCSMKFSRDQINMLIDKGARPYDYFFTNDKICNEEIMDSIVEELLVRFSVWSMYEDSKKYILNFFKIFN